MLIRALQGGNTGSSQTRDPFFLHVQDARPSRWAVLHRSAVQSLLRALSLLLPCITWNQGRISRSRGSTLSENMPRSTPAHHRRPGHDDNESPLSWYQELLLGQVPFRAWSNLLFVECGDGRPAEEAWRLLRRGYVCGVDHSASLIERARRLREVSGQLEFRVWDASHLPFPKGTFDLVLSCLRLEGHSEPLEVLREIWRVLLPGGELYLLQQEQQPPNGQRGGRRRGSSVMEPRRVRRMLRLMERAGFVDARSIVSGGAGGNVASAVETAIVYGARCESCT